MDQVTSRICKNPKCGNRLSDDAHPKTEYCCIECKRSAYGQRERLRRSRRVIGIQSRMTPEERAAWLDRLALEAETLQPAPSPEYVADPSVAYPDEKEEETGQ